MNLLNIQNWNFTMSGNESFVSALEHEHIKILNSETPFPLDVLQKFYSEEGCETLLDIGSWTGITSFKILSNQTFNKLILIDAVPLFLNYAKTLFQSSSYNLDNVFVSNTCIIDVDKGSFKDYILVDENDSYTLSSIYTTARNPRIIDPVILPVGELAEIPEMAVSIANLNLNNCFLKLTPLGLDTALLLNLLDAGVRPNVIFMEFSMPSEKAKHRLFLALERLRKEGYKVPHLKDILGENLQRGMLITSKNHVSMVVDTKPEDQVIPKTFKTF